MKDNITFETEAVKKLSIKKSIPLIISMMSLALYAIVDTIFVSNYSYNALEASVYSFPIVAIITAVGLGCGIGLSTTCAKALGEKNNYKAKNIIFNQIGKKSPTS